jgi:protein-tyrosine phosphatase
MIRQVLTVCVGNICRSPAAEALIGHRLDGLSVASAGLGAVVGEPVDPLMRSLLAEQGVDATRHRARSLTAWMVQASDLILVMESGHKQSIESQYPLARGRVFRLGHYGNIDVPDPYRQSEAIFRSVFALIEEGVDQWADRIRRIGYEARAA